MGAQGLRLMIGKCPGSADRDFGDRLVGVLREPAFEAIEIEPEAAGDMMIVGEYLSPIGSLEG